ncbi:MAG: hypothetical protein ACRECJ_03325, partial [Limisphaerales bacterium]
ALFGIDENELKNRKAVVDTINKPSCEALFDEQLTSKVDCKEGPVLKRASFFTAILFLKLIPSPCRRGLGRD